MITDQRETMQSPEPRPSFPNIHFESAIHPLIDSPEQDQVFKKYDSGDLNSHSWNKEVAKRIKTYDPEIIAIDGLNSSFPNSEQLTSNVWVLLPARPKNLTTREPATVYAVAGDVALYDLYSGILQSQEITQEDMQAYHKKLLKIRQKEHAEASSAFNAETYSTAFIYFSSAVTSVLTGIYLLNTSKGQSFSHPSKDTISRRSFLKLLSLTTAGLTVGSIVKLNDGRVTEQAAKTTSPQITDILNSVAEVLKPRFYKSTWVNGRTALEFAKTEDSIKQLGMPDSTPASIVMGTAHTPEAQNYKNNPDARNKAIADYAEHFLNILDQVMIETSYPLSLRAKAKNNLLDLLAETSVYKVTDPGGPDINPSFPSEIDKYVKQVTIFKSPQVLQSTSHLRVQE